MRKVRFRPAAERDLFELYAYIADTANRLVAKAYVERMESACLSLAAFPERGRSRDDIHAGLRTLAFERRALILFRISQTDVEIIRVLYGGRDIRGALAEE